MNKKKIRGPKRFFLSLWGMAKDILEFVAGAAVLCFLFVLLVFFGTGLLAIFGAEVKFSLQFLFGSALMGLVGFTVAIRTVVWFLEKWKNFE